MELHMKDNGSMDKDKAMDNKYGLMDQDMLDLGKTIKQMEKVSIHMRMVPDMKDNGEMINKMVLEDNSGQTDKFMKDNIKMDASMGKEN